MNRYKRFRSDSDSESLHSYTPTEPMSFGCIPINMDDDYGRNSARFIFRNSRIKFYKNWPFCVEESEAYFIDKIFKI